MYDFGLLLRRLREKSGMTQAQLAEKINRNKTAISKYESNIQFPTLDTLIELAVIFHVSLDYLAGLDKKHAISLQGMTEVQESILQELSQIFRTQGDPSGNGLSSNQLKVLNQILIEFTKS